MREPTEDYTEGPAYKAVDSTTRHLRERIRMPDYRSILGTQYEPITVMNTEAQNVPERTTGTTIHRGGTPDIYHHNNTTSAIDLERTTYSIRRLSQRNPQEY